MLTAVAFDGANLALPAGNSRYSNVSLQHHALFSLAGEHRCHRGSEQGGPCVATVIWLKSFFQASLQSLPLQSSYPSPSVGLFSCCACFWCSCLLLGCCWRLAASPGQHSIISSLLWAVPIRYNPSSERGFLAHGGEFPEISVCVWVSATWLLLTLMGVTLLWVPALPLGLCSPLMSVHCSTQQLWGGEHTSALPCQGETSPPLHPCPPPLWPYG